MYKSISKLMSFLLVFVLSLQVASAFITNPLELGVAIAGLTATPAITINQMTFCGYDTLIGDADCDNDIDNNDARLIAEIAAKLHIPPQEDCYLDVDGDGSITILDSLKAAQMAVGILESLGTCADVAIENFDPNDVECDEDTLAGDINNDGAVNYIDALIIGRMDSELIDEPAEICCFDVNNDGKLDILDSLKILQYENGIIPVLTTGCNEDDFDGDDTSGNALNSGLEIDRIVLLNGEYIHPGDDLAVAMDLENNGPKDLEGVRYRITIPELGVTKSGRYFDLDKRDDEVDTIRIEIPESAPNGDYLVRFEVSNQKNDVRRITHRIFTVA